MIRRLLAVCLLALPNTIQIKTTPDPIVFVHGNGDDAAKWIGIIGLFESNGYPPDRLYAVRFTNPTARAADHIPEAGHSSTVDQASELSAAVTRALLETHARKVILIGSSRGGMTIRNYLLNGGGASAVSAAILCGTPNHGVFLASGGLDGEFNGNGTFLSGLNQENEVVEGVRTMTLRSDKFDKYAQPDGRASSLPEHTGITFEGPALRGAENLVLPGADHRELAFSPQAFRLMYRFVTGKDPARGTLQPTLHPIVSGLVTGFTGKSATNLPASGVHLLIYALTPDSAQRDGIPAYETITDATGAWGPVTLRSTTEYEFELESQGRAVSYFKAPILRSTDLLNLRLPPPSPGPAAGTGRLLIARPEGYFSAGRDPVLIDGVAAKDEPTGLPVRDSFVATTPAKSTGVKVQLRGETIWARPSEDFATSLPIVDLLW